MTTENCLSTTPHSKVSEGVASKHTPNDLELEKELERKHLKCLEYLSKLRERLEPQYQDWYIAIDPESGVYMIEPDLLKFYRQINTYFPQTLDLGLYRLNSSQYIGRI
ncbi:MAG: hypothetical protein SWJ54_19080 [Cyanobacteriota bacterium]|nr:hypothetical protein [Cyanobacteriota bacterium]